MKLKFDTEFFVSITHEEANCLRNAAYHYAWMYNEPETKDIYQKYMKLYHDLTNIMASMPWE